MDNSNEYEKIPLKYKGEMFIEVTCKSFNIKFYEGDSLNQMRLFYKKNIYLNDAQLKKINHKKNYVFQKEKQFLKMVLN